MITLGQLIERLVAIAHTHPEMASAQVLATCECGVRECGLTPVLDVEASGDVVVVQL